MGQYVPPPMTTKAYPIGANSARTAGVVTQNNNIKMASKMQGKSGGKRKSMRRKIWQRWQKSRKSRKSRKKGGAAQIQVPLVKPLYNNVSGPDQSIGAGVTNLTKLGANVSANSAFDNCKTADCTASTINANK